jgi:hypothetical protein
VDGAIPLGLPERRPAYVLPEDDAAALPALAHAFHLPQPRADADAAPRRISILPTATPPPVYLAPTKTPVPLQPLPTLIIMPPKKPG